MKMIIKGMGVMAGVGLMMVAAGCRCPMSSQGACHDGNRYIQKVTLPQGGLVVVAEGDFEPRSLGSYSIRLYGADNPESPFDDFRSGLTRARPGGFIEKVLLKDLDGDGAVEVVVLFRGMATRSAEAFRVAERRMGFVESLKEHPLGVDCLKLLSFKMKPAEAGTKAWFETVEEVLQIRDAQGHGPDVGSQEWMNAVDKKVFPGKSSDEKSLAVGSLKWMEVVQMIILR